MTSRWYVLCSKPHKEQVVSRQLLSQGFDIYYPRYLEANDKAGKPQVKSYFPGYMFVKFDPNIVGLSKFQWMPNTEGLVCFGLKPAYVPDGLLDAIRRHVDQLNLANEESSLVSDLEANIETNRQESRLNEYGAIFDPQSSSDERVRALLGMLEGMSVSPTTRDS